MVSLLDTLRGIADAVAESIALIPNKERGRVLGMGADGTPTSEIDKIAENTVLDYITKNGIPLNVLSEEIGYVDYGHDEVLILDPIDGTSNAVSGAPMYSISMAVGRGGLKGVHTAYLRDLATGESMWAEKGKGAFKDGKRMAVRRPNFGELFMAIYTGNGANPEAYELAKRVKSRSYGCISLEVGLIAEGVCDGCYMNSERYSRRIRVVDIAASYLLLREAGGCVFDLSGREFDMPFDLRARSNFIACAAPSVYGFCMGKNPGTADRAVYGLVVNPNLPGIEGYSERVRAALGDEELVCDISAGKILGTEGTEVGDMDADVIITIGGDGTILRTLMGT